MIEPYQAGMFLGSGLLQTVLVSFLPVSQELSNDQILEIDVSDGDQIVVVENRPQEDPHSLTILVHGLSGDESSKNMVETAFALRQNGHLTWRMNQRGNGFGLGKAKQIYHGGRTKDLLAVIEKAQSLYSALPINLIGFSQGGVLVLNTLAKENPSAVKKAITVSTPLDIKDCVQVIHRSTFGIIDRHFVQELKKDATAHARLYPDVPKVDLRGVETLYEFDDTYTAPLVGYEGAEDFYRDVSPLYRLDQIKIPTTAIIASDDPVIDVLNYQNIQNPQIRVAMTKDGGHLAFLSWFGKNWLTKTLVERVS